MYFVMPVEGPRVLAAGVARRSTDPKLANGHAIFRVTQSYAARDYYWNDGRIHGALDFGNFVCGDRILAVEAGRVTFVGRDPYGALGVRIAHADGYTSEYWHLSAWNCYLGQNVSRGQVIGRVGGTGLAKGVCHLHFAMYRNGGRLDPWPLLHQPGASLPATNVPAATKGRARIAGPNCNIRSGAAYSAAVYARSRTDGYTYRASDGKRLWSNGSLYLFYGWMGEWAKLRTSTGLALYTHRSVTAVTVNP